MPKFKVRDTITYERIWHVEADTPKDAIALVSMWGDYEPVSEEQIGCTPFETEEIVSLNARQEEK